MNNKQPIYLRSGHVLTFNGENLSFFGTDNFITITEQGGSVSITTGADQVYANIAADYGAKFSLTFAGASGAINYLNNLKKIQRGLTSYNQAILGWTCTFKETFDRTHIFTTVLFDEAASNSYGGTEMNMYTFNFYALKYIIP